MSNSEAGTGVFISKSNKMSEVADEFEYVQMRDDSCFTVTEDGYVCFSKMTSK